MDERFAKWHGIDREKIVKESQILSKIREELEKRKNELKTR